MEGGREGGLRPQASEKSAGASLSTPPCSSPRPFVFAVFARRRDLRLTASAGAQSAPVGVGPWPILSRYRSSCQCLLGTDTGIPSEAAAAADRDGQRLRRPGAMKIMRSGYGAGRYWPFSKRAACPIPPERRPSHKSAGRVRSLPHRGPGLAGSIAGRGRPARCGLCGTTSKLELLQSESPALVRPPGVCPCETPVAVAAATGIEAGPALESGESSGLGPWHLSQRKAVGPG